MAQCRSLGIIKIGLPVLDAILGHLLYFVVDLPLHNSYSEYAQRERYRLNLE